MPGVDSPYRLVGEDSIGMLHMPRGRRNNMMTSCEREACRSICGGRNNVHAAKLICTVLSARGHSESCRCRCVSYK